MARTVTIADGASLSGALAIPEGYFVSGIIIPTTWTAAAVSFTVAVDNSGTFRSLFNTAGEVTFATDAAGRHLACKLDDFAGVRFLKVRSGVAAAAVNQVGADRVIEVLITQI